MKVGKDDVITVRVWTDRLGVERIVMYKLSGSRYKKRVTLALMKDPNPKFLQYVIRAQARAAKARRIT